MQEVQEGDQLVLVPERNNPKDPRAVAVYTYWDGQVGLHVG